MKKKPPAAGRGRPKGAKNKVSGTAKSNLIATFEGKGGLEAMIAWAEEHETEFYKLYAKLLPTEVEVSGKDGGPIGVRVKFGDTEIPL